MLCYFCSLILRPIVCTRSCNAILPVEVYVQLYISLLDDGDEDDDNNDKLTSSSHDDSRLSLLNVLLSVVVQVSSFFT